MGLRAHRHRTHLEQRFHSRVRESRALTNSPLALIPLTRAYPTSHFRARSLHTLTGAEILNTLSNHGTCTVVFSIVIMIICFLGTLPRKLEHVAILGIVSASELEFRV